MQSLHVVAAVILNPQGQCLLALRPRDKHQGGLWEFPGGKVEAGESPLDALRRELKEELDLTLVSAEPLLETTHAYPDRQVTLDVWVVRQFEGQARGMEGQALAWYDRDSIDSLQFPAANYPILEAVKPLLTRQG